MVEVLLPRGDSFKVGAPGLLESVAKARQDMAICNLIQKMYVAPGKNQTRTQLLSKALKALPSNSNEPVKIEKAVYKMLGKAPPNRTSG